MKNKRLLILVPNLSLGGQQRVAVNTAAILESEYEVTLAVFTLEGAVYAAPRDTIDLDIPPAPGPVQKIYRVCKRIKAVRKLKRERHIDVTISLGQTADLVNAFSRVADQIILSIRNYKSLIFSGWHKVMDTVIYNRADKVICVAQKITGELPALYKIPAAKVFTLYNPYDLDRLTAQASLPVPIPIRPPALVTMGRLDAYKGLRHLLHTFALVHQALPGASLVIIGEGPLEQELKDLTARLGLTEQVIFAGFQANPHSFLAKCDLYVLSSIREGFPNALVEAMACGLPVVAADCMSGPREILTRDYRDTEASQVEYADYGILTPPFASDGSQEDAKERLLAEAIIHILTDAKTLSHYRAKSLERARDFSFEEYKRQIIKIIEG